MTAIEVELSKGPSEYERLLSSLAHSLQTHRRLITLLTAERIDEKRTQYVVKKQGTYYPYVIEETSVFSRYDYRNMGFKI